MPFHFIAHYHNRPFSAMPPAKEMEKKRLLVLHLGKAACSGAPAMPQGAPIQECANKERIQRECVKRADESTWQF